MKKYNFVCKKHKYSKKSAFGGVCPICREDLKCLGDKHRIGRNGRFDKIERKTRKLAGQQPLISWERIRKERLERIKEERLKI